MGEDSPEGVQAPVPDEARQEAGGSGVGYIMPQLSTVAELEVEERLLERLISTGFGSSDVEELLWAESRGLSGLPGAQAGTALADVREKL